MRRRVAAVLIATLTVVATVGCSDDSSDPSTSTTVTTTTLADGPTTTLDPNEPADTTPVVGSIADVDFLNFTYDVGLAVSDDGGTTEIEVVDGVYSSGDDIDSVYFEVSDVDIADLDGDGIDEAAVSIFYTTGGTGRFSDALVFRLADGVPTMVASAGVGDRGDDGIDDVRTEAAAAHGAGAVLVIRRNADAEGACCPTALEERTFRLDGDELVEVGTAAKWAIVRIGVDENGEATSDPTEIKFLPGTSRADISGDATTPVAATFDANGGQTLRLELDADALADNPLVIVVSGPDGEAGRIGTGFDPTIELTLPATGSYRLQIDPVGTPDPDLGVYFDADLRIS